MGIAIAVPILWLIGVFWGGFVASTLWGWFMVPLGVVGINYWHAAGLAALLSVFLGGRGMSQADDKSDLGKEITFGFVCAVAIPLLALLAGWIAHLNM
ncbi:hypothetical protein [Burkholderia ubonensis]|uniref:hypothetical protein n=1 Tax=Burkholderia ubonensis TaxID=101571 RepID=UPI00075BB475|nr:hypothetical protein [Burkholderia ubonensis]KVP17288.1 hypothetical protein WJ84_03395 [Burkholderia ubonensis]KVP39592.1 hypothetical protein WJ87_04975 [Burkholderia ubonensis]